MKFAELKAKVRKYMTDDQIREFGPLTRRDTFEAALECCSEAIAVDADHALTEAEAAEFAVTVDELEEIPTPVTTQPTQYGPELVFIIPVLILILTAQLVWRGIRYVWPHVSRWLYHEFIGGLAAAALLLYRPKLA